MTKLQRHAYRRDAYFNSYFVLLKTHSKCPTWQQRSGLVQWKMADSLGLPLASLVAGQRGWGSLQGQRPAPSDQLQEQEPGRRLEW